MKLVVEIEYQESSMARNIAVDDVRRALIAFVPHKIISVKEAAQQSVHPTLAISCENKHARYMQYGCVFCPDCDKPLGG